MSRLIFLCDASSVISNEDVPAKIVLKHGNENLFSVFSSEKTDIECCHIRAFNIQFDFSNVKSFIPSNFPNRIKEEAEKVIEKTILCSHQINYLGHSISNNGSNISDSVSKNCAFVWSEECHRIFEKLKSGLYPRQLFSKQILGLPLKIYTDTSQLGFAGYPFIKYFSNNLDRHFQFPACSTKLSFLGVSLKYPPGTSNSLADSLSCLPKSAELPFHSDGNLNYVSNPVQEDNFHKMLSQKLPKEQELSYISFNDREISLNNIIYQKTSSMQGKKLCPVLTEFLYHLVIEYFHKSLGHPSIQRTLTTFNEYYFDEAILAHLNKYINSFFTC
uniref:Reverse transcriptase/retrotransposon-derived protein RNase H-like domain-containing protein n=1 Tax=Strongyloides stercoralis TaxID=6248 RepID=A0AAF5DHL7_STRER